MRTLLLALLLAAPPVWEGTVSEVRPLEQRFEIVSGDGMRVGFRVDPATLVLEGERRIHDQRLQPGDRVRVHGAPNGLASRVEIVGRGEDPEESPPLRAARVSSAETPKGRVLVDAAGLALYAFSLDETGEGALDDATSRCTGECARLWPPLLTAGPPLNGPGVFDDLLGHFPRVPQRADEPGIRQVSYDGWPLYRYHGDEPFTEHRQGTTRGEGLSAFGGFFRVMPRDGFPEREKPRGLPPPPPADPVPPPPES
jgi:predicted lipoprotein with Yx(FWY)xxD motif